MKIQGQIKKLIILISDEVNESVIVEKGEKYLHELRQLWKAHKEEFSQDDIDELKWAEDIIGRLYLVVEKISGLKIAGRVNKEIRELVERKSTLLSQALKQRSKEFLRAISHLNSKAPSCRKC